MIKLQCPKCGGVIEYEEDREFMFCKYCGTWVSNKPIGNMNPGGYPQQGVNAAPTANVTVSYTTTKPEYLLTIVIEGERWTFPNNTSKDFTLAPGVHIVLFYVGQRGWKKAVNVPFGNYPVRISVVYAGRVKIYIQ